mmetsp:Transcript_51926/g.131244  ORF Transcript_51926/g.131244 Transcript_51926/m.131244 type:complete len:230 (-) Transcript_51926:2381-3070(-)
MVQAQERGQRHVPLLTDRPLEGALGASRGQNRRAGGHLGLHVIEKALRELSRVCRCLGEAERGYVHAQAPLVEHIGARRLEQGRLVPHAVDAALRGSRGGRHQGEQGGLLELDLRLAALLVPAPADLGEEHVHAAEDVGRHDQPDHSPYGGVVEGAPEVPHVDPLDARHDGPRGQRGAADPGRDPGDHARARHQGDPWDVLRAVASEVAQQYDPGGHRYLPGDHQVLAD